MVTISGEEALQAFRDRLTGGYGLDLLRQHGGSVLIQLPVGVGKSRWLDAITTAAIASGTYDLVVVLCPTRRLINERAPLRRPPSNVRVVNLQPRPAKRCGTGRDAQWRQFEMADLGALGRADVCGGCPLRTRCFWPRQYGVALRGAAIIYATQAHLERSPAFLLRLRSWTGAARMLTLLDETTIVGTPRDRTISHEDLRRFAEVLRTVSQQGQTRGQHQRWLELVDMMLAASTADLQAPDWSTPPLHSDWARQVQSVGWQTHGANFRFLGYDLNHFVLSAVDSRRRSDNRDVEFSVRPLVDDCMVFSVTSNTDFTRFRLGKELASPFADHRFIHPDTRWHNLASRIGSRQHFPRNLPQVLDFFAGLVAQRSAEGKRVLLVAKKCFVANCVEGLAERFAHLGLDLRLVADDWSKESLSSPEVVPIIHYGLIGTNLFESFDVVYCLTGYYVNERVVNSCLQDVTRRDLQLPIKIETVGNPRRRRAGMADPDHRDYDVAELVRSALEFREHAVVVQAVGRVRPFTRPREVITFQMAELPGVVYDREFQTLAEARRYFGIASGRHRKTTERAHEIRALRARGLTQVQVAQQMGLSERTVRRYEGERNRTNSLIWPFADFGNRNMLKNSHLGRVVRLTYHCQWPRIRIAAALADEIGPFFDDAAMVRPRKSAKVQL